MCENIYKKKGLKECGWHNLMKTLGFFNWTGDHPHMDTTCTSDIREVAL